jgi:hypothetical protein
MFPHADTICTINTLNNQERLRYAASQRLAASAQMDKHRPVIEPASAHRVVATLFGGLLTRLHDASQGWVARPLTTGSAEPAHRVI